MKLKHLIITSVAVGATAFTLAGFPQSQAAEPVQRTGTAASDTGTPSPAVEAQQHINVDGTILDTDSKKPQVIYVQGQPLVALRQVAEALGYKVSWDGATKTTVIDMSVASLSVRPDVPVVTRKGKLTNINLDASESLLPAPLLVDGTMYISPSAFELLLNDVRISRDEIFIYPKRSELQNIGSAKAPTYRNGVETFLPPEKEEVIPYENEDNDTTANGSSAKRGTKTGNTVQSDKKSSADEPLIKVKRTNAKEHEEQPDTIKQPAQKKAK